MFKHVTAEQRLRDANARNAELEAENAKLRADLEYLAMMTDVEIDGEEEEEATENE